MKELRIKFQSDKKMLDSLSGLKIRLYPEQTACLICGKKTNLLKTDWKTCYSFDLGKFTLISGSNFCDEHKYFSKKRNQIIKYQSDLAALIVDKGYRVTFDLVVKVGRLRYDDHRQLEEIQGYLKCSPAKIELPLSTIGMIAKRFLEFCGLLHNKYEPLILNDIHRNGGFYLHFDGSTEASCGKNNLLLLDSRTDHVLDSTMIDGETYETVKKVLEKIKSKYGTPLATISDLRPGFVRVCNDVFGKKNPHISCHYHFLKTFRDDFLADHKLVRIHLCQRLKLKSEIEKQLKTLDQLDFRYDPNIIKSINEIEKYWIKTADILSTYGYILKWILNFKQDSTGKGVPFDLPYLDFYHRITAGKKVIDTIFEKTLNDDYYEKYYRLGFCTVAAKLNKRHKDAQKFRRAIRHLEYAKKWFSKLRGVLYLEGQTKDIDSFLAPLSKRYQLSTEEALSIPHRLTDYVEGLENEIYNINTRPDTFTNSFQTKILKRFQQRLEKHSKNLYVPVVTTEIDGKEVKLIPPRTNNCLESFFRFVKALIRRCTGRNKLPKEFGSIGAILPYYLSMRDHKTFETIYAGDKLVEEFSELFKKGQVIPDNIIAMPNRLEVNENTYLSSAIEA